VKNISFKEPTFCLSIVLFGITTTISVLTLDIKLIWKVIIIIIALVIFAIIQLLQARKIGERILGKIIRGDLKTAEQFRYMIPEQRIRSNIFVENKKKRIYNIKYQFNMEGCQDNVIRIPLNLGCTGEAWRTKKQVYGDYSRIRAGGEYKIPDDQLALVPEDLKWVISTPIKDKNGEVIGVLNLDGNKEFSGEQKDKVKRFCNELAEEIQKVLV